MTEIHDNKVFKPLELRKGVDNLESVRMISIADKIAATLKADRGGDSDAHVNRALDLMSVDVYRLKEQ